MTHQPKTTPPPYTITSTILDLAERIGEAIGRAEGSAVQANLRLRRVNRIRTIQGSLAIEGNTLTKEQISTILEGKPVVAPFGRFRKFATKSRSTNGSRAGMSPRKPICSTRTRS